MSPRQNLLAAEFPVTPGFCVDLRLYPSPFYVVRMRMSVNENERSLPKLTNFHRLFAREQSALFRLLDPTCD